MFSVNLPFQSWFSFFFSTCFTFAELCITSVLLNCDFRSKGVLHLRREPSPYKEEAKGNRFSRLRCGLALLESSLRVAHVSHHWPTPGPSSVLLPHSVSSPTFLFYFVCSTKNLTRGQLSYMASHLCFLTVRQCLTGPSGT